MANASKVAERGEQGLVQQLVAEPAVEAFDEDFLLGLFPDLAARPREEFWYTKVAHKRLRSRLKRV